MSKKLPYAGVAHPDQEPSVQLGVNTYAIFANEARGKNLITRKDAFIDALSPFDLKTRVKTDKDVSRDTFLKHCENNVLAWSDHERQKVVQAINRFKAKSADLDLPLPEKLYLVKTTGEEEAGAAYTRGNIIFLENRMNRDQEVLDWVFCHELFHVITRNNPALREKLYQTIGFQKCDKIDLPESIENRKITNPDAPENNHIISVSIEGASYWALPIIFSSSQNFDPQTYNSFFDYLQFRLLLVEDDGTGSGRFQPIYQEDAPLLYDTDEVTGYFEQIGENTNYIIHPEEILAENFAHMLMQTSNVQSPHIIEKMKECIEDYMSARQTAPKSRIDSALD